MKQLMIAALGAAALVFSVASPSIAQENERDYLVQQGKRPVWASQLRKQQEQQRARLAPSESARLTTQRGRILQQGKTQIFVPEEQLPLIPRLNRRVIAGDKISSPQIPSSGRFVQQGKVQVWVPNTLPTLHPDPNYVADELPKPGPTVID